VTEQPRPTDRLEYDGDFSDVVNDLADLYEIGKVTAFDAIEIGYEDCNVAIETDSGKYVAKIFAKTRSEQDVERYSAIMQRVVNAGVSHPGLLSTSEGDLVARVKGLSAVLMTFVDGKTFYELDRAPNELELQEVIKQTKKINAIEYRPEYLFDSWAIPNIREMLEKVRQFVVTDDLVLAEEAVKRFEEIPLDDLPHAFVHGDLTKANVMKTKDGKICVFDFSVANWYPRIQELAVIAANLLHDEASNRTLQENCEIVADLYGSLTYEERKHLPAYALAGVAMEFLGAHQEKYINGIDTEETEYWMNLGREGLRAVLLMS
jgi:Ser/Thr protein kinase RdoA (MazF antagonist)